jgi:hypothetical protein
LLDAEISQDKTVGKKAIENLDQVSTLSEFFEIANHTFGVVPKKDGELDMAVSIFMQRSPILIGNTQTNMHTLYHAFSKNKKMETYFERYREHLKNDTKHQELTQILENNSQEILTICKTRLKK